MGTGDNLGEIILTENAAAVVESIVKPGGTIYGLGKYVGRKVKIVVLDDPMAGDK